jgi:hypothetical protein
MKTSRKICCTTLFNSQKRNHESKPATAIKILARSWLKKALILKAEIPLESECVCEDFCALPT